MSRIGNQPIPVPAKTAVTLGDAMVHLKGPRGEAEHSVPEGISVAVEGAEIRVTRSADTPEMRRLHGVTRAHIANKVKGVSEGHSRSIIVNGKGYQGEVKGKILEMQIGFSHRMLFEIPKGLQIQIVPGQNTFTINISGINKELVGAFAAALYRIRPVEPYNMNGFRYSDQQVRRKATKTTK
jgi:large subunit ribosomal protein L6